MKPFPLLDDGASAKKSEVDAASAILKKEAREAKITEVIAETTKDAKALASDTYMATADDFSKHKSSEALKSTTETVKFPNREDLPWDDVSPESKEYMDKSWKSHVVVLRSENAKLVEQQPNRIGAGEASQDIMTHLEQFYANCGVDVKFGVYGGDAEIVDISTDLYADSETQGLSEATDFINTAETEGSDLDRILDDFAASRGISREDILTLFYVANTQGVNPGGGARTNNVGHGIALTAESNLGSAMFRSTVGAHEMVKMQLGETEQEAAPTLNKGYCYEIPRNPDGSLLYNFKEDINDTDEVQKITTMSFPGARYQRRIPIASGVDTELWDHESESWIPIRMGDENRYSWKHGRWDRLDFYGGEEVSDTTPPEVTSEGYSPSGMIDIFTNLNLKIPFTEPMKAGSGTLEIQNADGTPFASFDASEAVIDGNDVSFPAINLNSESLYRVIYNEGIFTDLSGNPCPAVSGDSWSIETPDVTGPEIVSGSQSPLGANIETTLKVEFNTNEVITIPAGAEIEIWDIDNNQSAFVFSGSDITVDQTGTHVSTIETSLNPATNYRVIVKEGAAIDENENKMTQKQWEFKTKDNVGIDEIDNKTMKLYPNPCLSNSPLTIEGLKSRSIRCVVFDMNGRVVYSGNFESNNGKFIVTPKDLSSGMHLVRIDDREGKEESLSARFIVQ